MKKILIGVVVVVVALAGVITYIFLNAGDIVKQVVEEVGSDATKTKVTLNSVDLSLQSGEAALIGFQMGNPEGFKSPKFMSFGLVSVKIDTGSLSEDVIVIKEVVIAVNFGPPSRLSVTRTGSTRKTTGARRATVSRPDRKNANVGRRPQETALTSTIWAH